MAPPRLYESPIEQLLRLLGEAKRRGLSFADAWHEAVRPGRSLVMSNTRRAPATAIRWPTDRTDRLAWQGAISATRQVWMRAYYNEAMSESEAAVLMLAEGIAALDAVAGERADAEGIETLPALQSVA